MLAGEKNNKVMRMTCFDIFIKSYLFYLANNLLKMGSHLAKHKVVSVPMYLIAYDVTLSFMTPAFAYIHFPLSLDSRFFFSQENF